jgi:hypothetical protein
MDVVARRVAQVLVVAARVVVGNETIHRGGQPDADHEARDHQRQLADVEPVRTVHAVDGLGQQAERGGRQHQPRAEPQDAVVRPAREIAHEQERQRAQAGGQTRKDRGQRARAHGPCFYIVRGMESNARVILRA